MKIIRNILYLSLLILCACGTQDYGSDNKTKTSNETNPPAKQPSANPEKKTTPATPKVFEPQTGNLPQPNITTEGGQQVGKQKSFLDYEVVPVDPRAVQSHYRNEFLFLGSGIGFALGTGFYYFLGSKWKAFKKKSFWEKAKGGGIAGGAGAACAVALSVLASQVALPPPAISDVYRSIPPPATQAPDPSTTPTASPVNSTSTFLGSLSQD